MVGDCCGVINLFRMPVDVMQATQSKVATPVVPGYVANQSVIGEAAKQVGRNTLDNIADAIKGVLSKVVPPVKTDVSVSNKTWIYLGVAVVVVYMLFGSRGRR